MVGYISLLILAENVGYNNYRPSCMIRSGNRHFNDTYELHILCFSRAISIQCPFLNAVAVIYDSPA